MSYICVFDKPVDKETPNLFNEKEAPSPSPPSPPPTDISEDECSISCDNDCCNEMVVNLPKGFSIPSIQIPRLPIKSFNFLKEATASKRISKVMFNKIISMKAITYNQLEDLEKIKEVLTLLDKKIPLKKCVIRVYA